MSDIATGLIGWWKFDEGSGTAPVDSSGNNLVSAFVDAPAWVAGKIGPHALSFDGSNDAVNLGTTAILNPAAITIAAWVNLPSFSSSFSAIYNRGNDADYYCQCMIKSTAKLSMWLMATGGSVHYEDTGTYTLAAGTWYHVVMTYDSATGLKGYLNANLDGSAAANGTLNTTAGAGLNTYIGVDINIGGRYFHGTMDDLRIYNRALTAADVAALYAYTGTSIKTANGLAQASVKMVNGLAIASVKSINGLA